MNPAVIPVDWKAERQYDASRLWRLREAMNRRQFLTRASVIGATAWATTRAGGASAAVNPEIYAKAEAAGFPKPKFIETNGIKMAVYEKGSGFPVVFSHGFPELAFSWRHQLDALSKARFRAIAPDQRGYGRTDRPDATDAYTIQHLTGDLAGMLDKLGIDKAVFCGHDWGGFVVWQMAHLHPDRVAGVIGVNTPYMPRGPVAPTQMLRQMRGENNYIVYFQQPGVADTFLAENVEKAFRAFLSKSSMTAEDFAKLPADSPARNFDLKMMIEAGSVDTGRGYVCTEDELRVYIETFRETGFTGGINWYRNMDRNWETTAGQPQKLNTPSLYVGAEDDVVLPPSMADATKALLGDNEMHVIQNCGHWTQQEKSEELNTILIGWLTKRFGRG